MHCPAIEMRDDEGDGIADGLTIDAAQLVTADLMDFTVFDSNADGINDYISSDPMLADFLSFDLPFDFGYLPLADTNGDGGSEALFTRSQILLFNLTAKVPNAQILPKNDQGNPLTVDLNGAIVAGEKSLQRRA